MNTEEMLLQIIEGQKQINERLDNMEVQINNRMDNIEKRIGNVEKRMDNIEVQLEEIRHDGKITRVATNRIGEMLEEHLLLENS